MGASDSSMGRMVIVSESAARTMVSIDGRGLGWRLWYMREKFTPADDNTLKADTAACSHSR